MQKKVAGIEYCLPTRVVLLVHVATVAGSFSCSIIGAVPQVDLLPRKSVFVIG